MRFGRKFGEEAEAASAAAKAPRADYFKDPHTGELVDADGWPSPLVRMEAAELQRRFFRAATPKAINDKSFRFADSLFQASIGKHDIEGMRLAVDEVEKIAARAAGGGR